jgi:RNA polymerase sigma-70 factor (ECF subfamily)
MYAYIYRMVQDADTAEDLLQEFFFRVWSKAASWTGEGSFKNWAFRIASNLALNYLRARKRKPVDVTDFREPEDEEGNSSAYERYVESTLPGPDTLAQNGETRLLIEKLVSDLPEKKRAVFQLIHEQELSVEEASKILGIPDGTVKSRLHYGRRIIAKKMNRYLAD